MKFAVIGCGNIAQRHSIPAIIDSGVSNISVCVDINPEREREVAEKISLPFETSLEQAIENYDIDAVYISTPNATHKEIILKAAQNKKHILCEKSIVTDIIEAREVVECCKHNNVALFEGFMYQFHTQHQFVRNLIAQGEIGTPFHFQAWNGFPPISQNDFRYKKKLGGGALLDAGAYTIHAARHFFNAEPEKIHAVLENEGHEVDVRGSVMFDFGDSRTAHLVFGFNNMYQNKYAIWGTEGLITLTRAFALPSDFISVLTFEKQGITDEYKMQPCNHFIEEIKYFVTNASNKEKVAVWHNEILNQAHVMHLVRGM